MSPRRRSSLLASMLGAAALSFAACAASVEATASAAGDLTTGATSADTDDCARMVDRWMAERERPAGVAGCLTDPQRCGLSKSSQYDTAVTSAHGAYACGLVASSSAVPRQRRLEEIGRVRANAGTAYGNSTGIQPHALASALAPIYPSSAVQEHDRSSLIALHDAVARGDLVVVDHLGTEGAGRAAVRAEGRTFAHFSRVLALDPASGTVFLENSLTPGGESAFAVDARTFCEAWKLPETAASSRPDVPLDPVTRWFVSVDAAAVDAHGRGCAQEPRDDGSYCGESLGGRPSVLYTCTAGAVTAITPCASGCNVAPQGSPDRCR